jgi:hypothetical protein
MALERKTLLDQVEIRRDGTLQVRLVKAIVDGEAIAAQEFHRTVVEPGVDPEAQLAALNASLLNWPAEEGGPFAAIESGEWDCVRRASQSEHTPEVVIAYREKEALAIAASNGADIKDASTREAILQKGRERAADLLRERHHFSEVAAA